MSNIFIIHGVGGHPQENWNNWLTQKLQALGHNVIVPQFPTPENQTLDNWLAVLDKYKKYLTPDMVFIGHSLGVAFTLSVLEKYPAKAAFLVAGFDCPPKNQFDESMKTFTEKKFDWNKIKSNCQNFMVFHSDNDPYVKLETGQKLADDLGVKLTLVKNAGHFNSAAGYDKFELLLEKILYS
ncbi:MAG: hypothetical protein COU31_03215 [Candidatus Magasanikbacteria bacterium CG10_big_fil_rev_8_21_14_0_10_40_10]|uniref:Serine hydrolase family protein n=1 Tax=Candidatus Magasanikbacteria bacterium CG10_big_fil_rev_8_21_14_0_10_40_10 TaxID=1974648 RepID=A0A2M6W3M3_9BACT|nr:MAG: hypothetical protein COU31_03215 [Candidatus Magasanikbacteria bacterium CG10_big_fil_rev_8_21_14_0_10_40_10]